MKSAEQSEHPLVSGYCQFYCKDKNSQVGALKISSLKLTFVLKIFFAIASSEIWLDLKSKSPEKSDQDPKKIILVPKHCSCHPKVYFRTVEKGEKQKQIYFY